MALKIHFEGDSKELCFMTSHDLKDLAKMIKRGIEVRYKGEWRKVIDLRSQTVKFNYKKKRMQVHLSAVEKFRIEPLSRAYPASKAKKVSVDIDEKE